MSETCDHSRLYVDANPFSHLAGFKRVLHGSKKGKSWSSKDEVLSDFPGPLVLPDDCLADEPEDPQDFKEWKETYTSGDYSVRDKAKALYIVTPPTITKEVEKLMTGWDKPHVPDEHHVENIPPDIPKSKMEDIRDYLQAFYHLMGVKILDKTFAWRKWPEKRKMRQGYIGLETPSGEVVRVRHRPSPDGIARNQLNLNDILDALGTEIPEDAHAICMMIDQDLYEDDEDDFCCGRAYGGSHICVVSSFRYHPCLDGYAGIDNSHAWPASHCKNYVDELSSGYEKPRKQVKSSLPKTISGKTTTLALSAAVEAATPALALQTTRDYAALWFSRVARTASHEIGHCMCLGHCVYYACVMQSTANMAEDIRQPPYLCSVCLDKLAWALGPFLDGHLIPEEYTRYKKVRYEALYRFCEKWKGVGMFAGYGAWLGKRIESMGEIDEE